MTTRCRTIRQPAKPPRTSRLEIVAYAWIVSASLLGVAAGAMAVAIELGVHP